eukprot:jgi/Tetstr1/460618/TSEL_000543.t1
MEESGHVLIAAEAEAAGVPVISNMVYSHVTENLLLWCESCGQLREDSNAAGTFAATPKGALLLLGGDTGEVIFYCSSGERSGDDDGVIRAVRSDEDADSNPAYFWQAQRISMATTPELDDPLPSTGSGSGDTRSGLEGPSYGYVEGVGCKDPTLGDRTEEVSSTDCEASCSSTPACRAFTFTFLKAACDDARLEKEDYSGMMVLSSAPSTPQPPACEHAIGSGCKLYPNLAILRAVGQASCESACLLDARCAAYTFTANAESCYLKTSCELPSSLESDMTCIKRDPIIAVIRATTRERSESTCRAAAVCRAYTIITVQLDCFLKAGCEVQTVSMDQRAPVSTPPSTDVATTTSPGREFQLFFDVGCKDKSLRVHRDVSQEECEALCAAHLVCVAYTHNRSRRCFLKRARDVQQPTSGDVTGLSMDVIPPPGLTPAPTPAATPASNYIFELTVGVGCDDATLESIGDASIQQYCEIACVESSRCAAFTYDPERRRCFLKASCEEPKSDTDNLAGVRVAFEYLAGVRCDDKDLAAKRGVSSAGKGCQEACREEVGCRFFFYNADDQKCSLKRTCGDRTHDSDSVSASKRGLVLSMPAPAEGNQHSGGELVGGWEWRDEHVWPPTLVVTLN